MRLFISALILTAVAVPRLGAQTTATNDPAATPPEWEFSASVYTYFVPDGGDFVQPTFTADRDWLHLEARYNYEAINTASVWAGYNLSGGDKLAWELTPMLGGVFGDTTGIAPGYKGSLSWWKLEFFSEGELLIDAKNSSDSFFYNWNEFTYSPVDWFRFGLVAQHTRAYETDHAIERGLLVGFKYKRLDFSTYVFNPFDHDTVVALAVRLDF